MALKTGFLPEPIPTVELPKEVVEGHIRTFMASTGNIEIHTESPALVEAKMTSFRQLTAGMTVEQVEQAYPDVFTGGLAKSRIEVNAAAIRGLATDFGEQNKLDHSVEQVLEDPRLFRTWIKAVCSDIATDHFEVTATAFFDVPHIDIPMDPKVDTANLIILIRHWWSEETETYQTKSFVVPIKWLGRNVIRTIWADYIGYLLGVICNLCV